MDDLRFDGGIVAITGAHHGLGREHALLAVLAHRSCPVSGEAVQTGAGRVARFVLATTEGWQAPGDDATPEGILEHWDEVMAKENYAEPVGSLSDLLSRRGMYPHTVAELIEWVKTGRDPASGPA